MSNIFTFSWPESVISAHFLSNFSVFGMILCYDLVGMAPVGVEHLLDAASVLKTADALKTGIVFTL